VLDVSATEFAKHFYWWLALGSTVGDAAREARVAVNYSVAGENIDWAVPVVYARNPGRMIYTDEERERVEATLLRPAEKAKQPSLCKGFKGMKVGLWDVNHVLPELDDFASTLNGRQNQFCFQAVEVSAPLGTWRRTTPTGGGASKGYIDGDEVAMKLRDQVASLGVDRLICITSFALADKQDKGLALWNEDKNQRVTIISGELIFGQPAPPRTNLYRFVANLLVSALCGMKGHATPPENCPNHAPDKVDPDPQARLAYLTAPLQLCEYCSEALKLQAESLNRILSTW
jgi:hypothetical protein